VRQIEGQAQFITSKGYWYVSVNQSLRSSRVENFASPEELEAIAPYLPATAFRNTETGTLPIPVNKVGDIPINVAAPIVEKLAQFEHDVNEFRRKHAHAFDTLYDKVADDEDLVEWRMEEFVPKVLGIAYSELSSAGMFALERFSQQKENGIFASRMCATPIGFWVRPRQDMRMKDEVMDWARKYQESAARAALGKDVKAELRQNPLSSFIYKAHRLILKSRKLRSPTTIGVLGPSSESGDGRTPYAVDTGETLTKTDKQIIRFLFETQQMMPPLVPHRANSICALIYRAIGAYPNLSLGRKVASLLLQELGVISPWKQRRLNGYQFYLPGLGIWPSKERLRAKAEESCKDSSLFRDSVKHVRKDWGPMPVYCIDSSDALEIDDGVSIQRGMDRPDCAWIHIHIANPAAYISPGHPIEVAARETLTSIYTPTIKFSMMPRMFTQELSSLAANRPVMTVSTLLEPDGSVTDIRLSLGIIHNIIKLTPNAVERALGSGREQATMIVGGGTTADEKTAEKDSEILEQALPDLRLLRQFLGRRHEKRLVEWPEEERIRRTLTMIRYEATTNLIEEPAPVVPDKIRHWKGDPTIMLGGDRFPRHNKDMDSSSVVEHTMLLAGESAAKWCKDREIPIFFQAATPHPLWPVSKLNQLDDADFRLEPAAGMSSSPIPHWTLNMWQYTKLTSPLRRYPDLVNQWQIQGYLEAISRDPHGLKDAQSLDPISDLPFSREALSKSIKLFDPIIGILQKVSSWCTGYWTLQAFFRAFHFKEVELPEVWDFKVGGPGRETRSDQAKSTGILGYLLPFHANAELLFSEEHWEKDVQRNQYLPVKIEMVDVLEDKVVVTAVGPPSDTPTMRQPIHIRPSKQSVPLSQHGAKQQQL
jgi:RNB domain